MEKIFSIIIVCLNPGEKLSLTLQSIEKQTFRSYEVVIKDGLSTDGSLNYAENLTKHWKESPTIKIVSQRDNGIYDAMNQAVQKAEGRYIYFLNAGDYLYSENVLQEMAHYIEQEKGNVNKSAVFYGNIFERLTTQKVVSNPKLDDFGCYRNVPCHQACFYSRELLLLHPFELKYRVRADYEHFLWCYFKGNADFFFKNILIADYEGGGFSETRQNRRISAKEHQEIVKKYMSSKQIFKYRLILWLTLAPLRTALAENPRTAGIYSRLKGRIYIR